MLFSPISSIFIWIMGLYFIIKGIIFVSKEDIASFFDIVSGAIILSSLFFSLPLILAILVAVYIGQKESIAYFLTIKIINFFSLFTDKD